MSGPDAGGGSASPTEAGTAPSHPSVEEDEKRPAHEKSAGASLRERLARVREAFARRLGRLAADGKIVLGVPIAVLTLMVAANGFEEGRLQSRRAQAEHSYYTLLSNLGSQSAVVRVGAIGQIAGVLVGEVPSPGRPRPWEGLGYVLGLHEHAVYYPYHEDLLRVVTALIRAPKAGGRDGPMESEALVDMLCSLGSEGWYRARNRKGRIVREKCLSWLWHDSPTERITDRPSYSLFRRSVLRDMALERFDLAHAEFSHSTLRNVSFAESTVDSAVFRHSSLDSVSFQNADLEGADFRSSVLLNVTLAGANLRGADFTDAIFRCVDFAGAQNPDMALGLISRRVELAHHRTRSRQSSGNRTVQPCER